MLRPALLAALLACPALPAAADALDTVLSGVWGSPQIDELRCRGNAKTPELAAPGLLRFRYDSGIFFPPGRWTGTLDYRVLARGEDWLRLAIPNEYREFAGRPIVWILQFHGPDRFDWRIDGDPSGERLNPQIRCPAPAATS